MDNKFIYEYLTKLTEKLNTKQEKFIDKQEKVYDKLETQLINNIKDIKKELDDKTQHKEIFMYRLMEKMKNYHIKDGYWYYEDKKLVKAEATDGKDGINGKDGKDGLNGKDGRNGVDGRNGRDGKDGKDGKKGADGLNGADGLTPVFTETETETLTAYEKAKVEIIKNNNKYKLKFSIPKGLAGHNGPKGDSVKYEEITYEEWLSRKNAGTLDEFTIYYEGL